MDHTQTALTSLYLGLFFGGFAGFAAGALVTQLLTRGKR